MRLTARDMIIFKSLDKFRVLDIRTTAKLCDFSLYEKCANRMKILHDNDYLNYYQESINTKRYYYLSGKGMNAIYPAERRTGKDGKTYLYYKEPAKFRKANLDHEITVADIFADILKCNKELTIDDFQSDREMQTFSKNKERTFRHYCDLQCERYRIKIEVELSKKDKKTIEKNMCLNGRNYIQIWIAGNKSVYNRLINVREKLSEFHIYILELENLSSENLNLLDYQKKEF